MDRTVKFLLISVAFGGFFSGFLPASVSGQESTTTVETRGFGGVKEANVFAPKYKERIQTYSEQIQMGSEKGWLTPAEVGQFTSRLEQMKQMESAAAAKGWPKADIDAVEKVFQKFNIDLTAAANKPPASSQASSGTVESSATSATKPSVSSTPAKPVSTKGSGTSAGVANKKVPSTSKKTPAISKKTTK